MKKTLVLAIACALVSGAALAVWNAQDVVPAASLLVPYAVVGTTTGDVVDPTGYTTLFSITNVSSVRQIVHLTAWNALSEPVVDWDILLTGYDVWSINFADLLNGAFDKFDTQPGNSTGPFGVSAPAGYQYGPVPYGPSANTGGSPTLPWVAPPGATSSWWRAADLPSAPQVCRMPYGPLTDLGPTIRRKIREAEVSIELQYFNCQAVAAGNPAVNTTWTADMSKQPLFFYVTADVVKACSTTFQTSTTYWNVAVGVGPGMNAPSNVITGDIVYINFTKNYSEMINAVHLEASPATVLPAAVTNFYELDLRDATSGGWVGTALNLAVNAVDDREPIGNGYAFRYSTAPSDFTSEAIVWKSAYEIGILPVSGDFFIAAWACSPFYYYAWNEDELTKSTTGGPSGFSVLQPNPLPYETQAVQMTTSNFPGLVTVKSCTTCKGAAGFGWIWMVFDGGDWTAGDVNVVQLQPYEAWVAVRFVLGGYSAATEATLMNFPWNQTMAGVGATLGR